MLRREQPPRPVRLIRARFAEIMAMDDPSRPGSRIGDARSTYEDGILTRVNRRAVALGIAPGMSAREFVAIIRRAAAHKERHT